MSVCVTEAASRASASRVEIILSFLQKTCLKPSSDFFASFY